MAADAAMEVFMTAWAATPLAASAEPALKPNQPNHRMPVPSSVSGSEWGGMASRGQLARRPDHQHHGQGRGAGVDVHDGAAGEVERAPLGQPAAARTPSGRPGA